MMTQISNFSPARAALLGVVPGMGAAYNRQYDKAVAHFGMFAALCILADEGHGVIGMAAAVFYVFTILDAYRSAQFIQAAGRVPGDDAKAMNLPLWGGLLILLGLLFFLDNLGALELSDIVRYSWPLLFVGTGAYLIFRYYVPGVESDLQGPAAERPASPHSPPPAAAPGPASPPQPPASGSTERE